MASRNGSERGAVVAQSACPLFAVTAAPAVATILPLPPFSVAPGPDGINPAVAEAGQLYIIQCTANMQVRLVGNGTVASSGTVTYTAPAGAQTVTILGRTLSFTSSGVAATDATTLASLVLADPILNKSFSASSAAAVCTITYKVPGAGGNLFTFTVTGTGAAASGAGFLTGGVGPAAGSAAGNSYTVLANQPFFVYRLPYHTQIDVTPTGASTVNVHLGV